MNGREEILEQALREIEKLLTDWPTMRALSASGAATATKNKAAARKIISEALATISRPCA